MAIVGSLASSPFADRWGRKPVIFGAAVLFTIGGVVCAAATEKICLLVGRILLGIASMIVPIYVGETAPSHIRGRLITAFQMMIGFGQLIANFLSGKRIISKHLMTQQMPHAENKAAPHENEAKKPPRVFSYANPVYVGWRLMLGVASLPAIIQLAGFIYLPESPRFLFYNDRKSEAIDSCGIDQKGGPSMAVICYEAGGEPCILW
uniref:Major facilitator superfamily (MFS) profile domain-containing protein n=1 Tax=Parascaris equorum TaxID=6256 RepID=A0A914S423_PAREQ